MEGVRQSGAALRDLGHEQEVVTLDERSAPFLRGLPEAVHALGPSHLRYRYNARLVDWLVRNARSYDAVIVNGLWQYHSFGVWRAARKRAFPYFVFPHGMLDPWFKYTYPVKHLKKWLYWTWADYRVVRDARAVLFTSEEERLLARRSFWLYRATEHVVGYGTSTPPPKSPQLVERFFAAYPQLRGKRLLLFLGRIHNKKGCDLLLRAFARIARTGDARLHLIFCGAADGDFAAALKHEASISAQCASISWLGHLQDDLKWGAFHSSELFLLPSHQENFGVAVAESLGCGLPVLISDKVNIWREVKSHGAGLVCADTVDGITAGLQAWLALSGVERSAMAMRARMLFYRQFTAREAAQGLLRALANSC